MMRSTSLLKESTGKLNRGIVFERTIYAGLVSTQAAKNGQLLVNPDLAGNRNDISDLGFEVMQPGAAKPIPCGAEIKLNFDANLGSIWLNNFESLAWSKKTNNFIYEIAGDKDEAELGPTQSIALNVAAWMSTNNTLLRNMRDIVSGIDARLESQGLEALPDEINLLQPLGNNYGNQRDREIFAYFSTNNKTLSRTGLQESILPGFVEKKHYLTISSKEMRAIIANKRAPNGAPTSYIIIGNDKENSVEGDIYRLVENDPLGLQIPQFNPPETRVSVRFGQTIDKKFMLRIETKLSGGSKPSMSSKFNSADELAAILLGENQLAEPDTYSTSWKQTEIPGELSMKLRTGTVLKRSRRV